MAKSVFDGATSELLGAHKSGAKITEPNRGDGIVTIMEGREEDLMLTIFPHPTLSETMYEARLVAYGKVMHN